jgi:hypothetical protein
MSKQKPLKPINFEKLIMDKVKSKEIVMKPRWYFVLGSVVMIFSLVAATISSIFLINLIFFLLRKHGPRAQWRLELMLNSFPWWIPIMAIAGLLLGVWLLKQYDFSFKKDFRLVTAGFILAIILAAFIIDLSGLNDIWFRRGMMRNFYQQIEKPYQFNKQYSEINTGKGMRRFQNKD